MFKEASFKQGLLCLSHPEGCIEMASARRHSRRGNTGNRRLKDDGAPCIASAKSLLRFPACFTCNGSVNLGKCAFYRDSAFSIPGLVSTIWGVLN